MRAHIQGSSLCSKCILCWFLWNK